MRFTKQHDPCSNAQLLKQFAFPTLNVKTAVAEAEARLQQMAGQKKVGWSERIFSKASHPSFQTYLAEDELFSPSWRPLLDAQYKQLLLKAREVNVTDYGARGDGVTDDTAAFQRALRKGYVKLIIPAGVFVVRGLHLPSWTYIEGCGKGKTILKLHPEAPKEARLLTNANYWRGNRNICVRGLTLDWNVERLGAVGKTSTGGNRSSCLTFAHVKFGWVQNVEAMNPGLHCFDISSPRYSYTGDGTRAWGGSSYIWLDCLHGSGFGDDGITTHHSRYIYISRSHMCDPSGKAHTTGASNSNGIEIDDGSRDVLLSYNSTARCFGGVEVKAHHNSSAATNVQIIGHISYHDNRSYNFRHIGHHLSADPESKTAYNICATQLLAIAPVYTDLYKGSTPRGMVISAYRNVVVNYFTLLGDKAYDYRGNPVIAVQYRARNILLQHVTSKNFQTARADIQVFGGKQCADQVELCHVTAEHSAASAIEIGEGVSTVSIHHLRARHTNGECAIRAAQSISNISQLHVWGYKTNICEKRKKERDS